MKISAKIGAVRFDGDTISVVVANTAGRLPTIIETHTERAKYADPEDRVAALTEAAKAMVARIKNRPAAYVLCVPCDQALARVLLVPFRGHGKIAAAIQFELEPYLAIPVDELVVDFVPVREIDGKTEVLAAGVRIESLQEYVEILNEAGIDLAGIDLDICGAVSLWQARKRPAGVLSAILDVGQKHSTLAILRNKALALFRQLPISADDLRQRPVAAARELNNTLRGFMAEQEIDVESPALSVCGLELLDEESEALKQSLNVPVSFEDLLEGVKGAALVKAELESANEFNPAIDASQDDAESSDDEIPQGNANEGFSVQQWQHLVGLCMGASGAGNAFNFRKGDLGTSKVASVSMKHAVFSVCLLVAAIVGYAGYCFVEYRSNVAQIDSIGEEIWDLAAGALPKAKFVVAGRPSGDYGGFKSYESMREEIEAGGGAAPPIDIEMFGKPGLLDVLDEISSRMPGDKVLITSIIIKSGRSPRIEISGESITPTGFTECFDEMKKSEMLDVHPTASRSSEGGTETFTIRARR